LGMANGLVYALDACPRVDQRPSDMRSSDSRRNLCPLGRALLVQRQPSTAAGDRAYRMIRTSGPLRRLRATSKGADLIKFRLMCPTA
jgi:hypothetical protein